MLPTGNRCMAYRYLMLWRRRSPGNPPARSQRAGVHAGEYGQPASACQPQLTELARLTGWGRTGARSITARPLPRRRHKHARIRQKRALQARALQARALQARALQARALQGQFGQSGPACWPVLTELARKRVTSNATLRPTPTPRPRSSPRIGHRQNLTYRE